MLYLCDADIRALAITPGEVADQVREGFRARRAGEIVTAAKQHLAVPCRPIFFQSLPCVHAGGYASVKWIGVSAVKSTELRPSVNTMLCLSDAETARPVAVMDANWITGMRTAAVSLLGGLCVKGGTGSTVGILGTGTQARTHLEMFGACWPTRSFVIWGRRREQASELCGVAADCGHQARIADDPSALIAECDVVISALSADTTAEVGFDAGALRPGALLSLVDLGRPWLRDSLQRLVMYTDDCALTSALMREGQLPISCRLAGDLVHLVSIPIARRQDTAPCGLVHPGVGYADLALAEYVFARARENSVGTVLD